MSDVIHDRHTHLEGCCGSHTVDLPEALVRFRDVRFSYDETPVFNAPVTFGIAPGDFACIVGPNGGGKTTLLKLTLGLLRPQTGAIEVLGAAPGENRQHVGYMPQHAQLDLKFPVTVLDVVLMGRLHPRGPLLRYSRVDAARAREALEQVRMGHLARRPFAALSGGQRQRVLIARALACEPKLLLLDEPTAGLDVAAQGDLYQLLNELNKRMTIFMVSHDVSFVSKFVKTVICVNRKVDVHATMEIAGDYISEMYGRDMRIILHEHEHR